MNKKVLTIIASVLIGLLVICTIIGVIVWKSAENNLKDTDEFFDFISNPSLAPTITENINQLIACDYLTSADAEIILGTKVRTDINDGSNACTYFVDDDDLTDFRRIALVMMGTGSAENAKNDFEMSKKFFQQIDIKDVTIADADFAFYSEATNQLYVLKDNNYFIVVAIASEFDSHLETARQAAAKILARL